MVKRSPRKLFRVRGSIGTPRWLRSTETRRGRSLGKCFSRHVKIRVTSTRSRYYARVAYTATVRSLLGKLVSLCAGANCHFLTTVKCHRLVVASFRKSRCGDGGRAEPVDENGKNLPSKSITIMTLRIELSTTSRANSSRSKERCLLVITSPGGLICYFFSELRLTTYNFHQRH